MNEKIVQYAMKQLNIIGKEEGFVPFPNDNYGIYIEFISGRTLNLSEDEIKFKATEYLNSELEEINHA